MKPTSRARRPRVSVSPTQLPRRPRRFRAAIRGAVLLGMVGVLGIVAFLGDRDSPGVARAAPRCYLEFNVDQEGVTGCPEYFGGGGGIDPNAALIDLVQFLTAMEHALAEKPPSTGWTRHSTSANPTT